MSLSLFLMGMVPSVLIWVILADYLPAKAMCVGAFFV